MREIRGICGMAAAVVLLGLPIAQDASAQKIVCWKDKAGKTVGCGDKVPPEYQDNASQEIDKRGVVRKTNESADEKAKRLVKEKEDEKTKAERDKKAAEQRRLDSALVNTYTNEKEIDLRRDRDLATIDGQITQMKVMQKNAQDRQKEVKTRIGAKPATEVQKEELARADATVTKADQAIVDKEKEKEDIRARYAAMRARFTELKGGSSAPAPAPASTAKK